MAPVEEEEADEMEVEPEVAPEVGATDLSDHVFAISGTLTMKRYLFIPPRPCT